MEIDTGPTSTPAAEAIAAVAEEPPDPPLPSGLRFDIQTLAQHLTIGLFLNNRVGDCVWVSERCAQITGVRRTTSGGFAWLDRVHPDDRDRVTKAWAVRVGGEHFRQTFRFVHVDGEERLAAVRVEAVNDESGEGVLLGIVEDLTDSREARSASGTRRLMFDAVLSNSSDLVVVVGPDAKLLFVSEAARRILGRDPATWVGRNVFDLLHPDDVGHAAEALAGSIDTGPGVKEPAVVRVQHSDGSWRSLEIQANNLEGTDDIAGLVITARDLSERLLAEESADMARSRFERAFDHAPIGMALIDPVGHIIRSNKALADMLGRPRELINGSVIFDFAHSDDREVAIEHALEVLSGSDRTPLEVRFTRHDETIAWARVSATVMRDDEGNPVHVLAHLDDVTEEHRLRSQLAHAATHDPLTGLLNRKGFEQELTERRASVHGTEALLMLDLDGFKPVNDTLGHHAGDEVLEEVARRLLAAAGRGSTVARLGGDEFAVHLLPVDGVESARAVADRIKGALGAPYRLSAGPAAVTGSAGLYVSNSRKPLQVLLAAADEASYGAKRAGGDRVHMATNPSQRALP